MRNYKDFLLKVSNQSVKNIKIIYNQNLMKEIQDLYELFNNKKVIEIIFLNNHKEAIKLLGCNVVPKWIRGFTLNDNIYMLKYTQDFYSDMNEFQSVLLHEITHALIYRKVNQYCPLWLNEGLALILSKQYKNIDYECFLEFNYELASYDYDCFYEKCCAKTMNYIKKYEKKQFITKLITNEINF